MLYTKTFEYMTTIIHDKGYYTFCQVSVDEMNKMTMMFVKENKNFMSKDRKNIRFKGKDISIFQAMQNVFQEAVAYVAHETSQNGNGGWE